MQKNTGIICLGRFTLTAGEVGHIENSAKVAEFLALR